MNNSVSALDPCGIEVSQLILVVALRRGDRDESPREFPNTAEGHQAVLRFLARSAGRVKVAMESTGLYGLDLALALHQAGVAVMVANPRAVRHFAQATMQRSKNDQLDSVVLREFVARMEFQAWRPPSASALKLVAVARRLEALTGVMAAETNRLTPRRSRRRCRPSSGATSSAASPPKSVPSTASPSPPRSSSWTMRSWLAVMRCCSRFPASAPPASCIPWRS